MTSVTGARRGRTAALIIGLIAMMSSPPMAKAPAAPQPATTGGEAPEDATTSGLRALHRGDYSRALGEFKRSVEAAPGAPGPLFYLVFSRWWQMVFAGEAPAREDGAWSTFEAAYDDVVRASTARLEAAPDDAEALAAMGGVEVLRAHVEAQMGSYFHAGAEARRGKKALGRALALVPDLSVALFPLGALNYFADRVPLIVKTLRPLMFLPGGDARAGLGQVRQVAMSGSPLSTDARLLLGLICADRYQQAYHEALDHLRIADRMTGGSPLIDAAIADLQQRLGEPDDAAATLAAAVVEADGPGPERARQRRWLRLGEAEALVAGWRLEEGAAALGAAAHEGAAPSSALERVEERVREEMEAKKQAVPFLASGSPPGDPIAALGEIIHADPAAPIPRLARGRLLLQAGRDQEAKTDFDVAAAGAQDGPAWLAGWAELYSGLVERRLGHARDSRSHLQHAAAMRRFRAADRARLEIGERGEDADLCAP